MHNRSFILALLPTLWLSGCATIFGSHLQVVTVQSNVAGAEVLVDGVVVGQTPYSGQLKRASSRMIIVRKEGLGQHVLNLQGKVRPLFFGNITSGHSTGSTTDLMTGAAYEYAPSSYFVTLAPPAISAAPEFRKLEELRAFALLHFPDLQREALLGQGEYLQAFCSLWIGNNNAEALAKVRAELLLSQGDAVRFAQGVVSSSL